MPPTEEAAPEGNSIRVAIRCRPFNARELTEDPTGKPVLECFDNAVLVDGGARESSREGKTFGYDHVFGVGSTQEEIFEAIGVKLLDNALNAYNGCIFAYGQTGAGKSHSVVGDLSSEEEKGILPRATVRLFEMLNARRESDPNFQATVLVSYLEIYNEKLFDLLGGGSREAGGDMQVRLHPQLGAIVVNLTECPMESFEEALELFNFGARRRATGATQMNAVSSRSHAVFTMQIRMLVSSAAGAVESQAKIHFVDLAGSEKQKKSGATGARLKEGIGINQSLTTLGRVISDLTRPGSTKAVPPFRDSKLTLLLKDALMGNSRTELLACISPARCNVEESISTLEFASRCKLVKTSARKNEHSRLDIIAKLTAEKSLVETQLQQQRAESEELCKQLQLELEKAEEKQRNAERILDEKRQIEEQLQELRGRTDDMDKVKEEHEKFMQERAAMLEEKEQGKARLEAQKDELERTQALLKQREELLRSSVAAASPGSAGTPEEDLHDGESLRKTRDLDELKVLLEKERRMQLEREEDLMSHMEALRNVKESWELDKVQIDSKREEMNRIREAERSQLGVHFLGIDPSAVPEAPKLVNLHPDPALKGCLVYYLPVGETLVGSDGEQCQVLLTGIGMVDKVCQLTNGSNEELAVRPFQGCLVRVNGTAVGEDGQDLHDGDRLAIGRAYIFQVQIPKAALEEDGAARLAAESEFEQAMDEILACAEVDPQWENGVQRAMRLVKSDFGTEAAGTLLKQARRASEVIARANYTLKQLPQSLTDGVTGFELSVMFDARGLPKVCVLARREEAGHAAAGTSTAGIWELAQFESERLEGMKEALVLADPRFGEDNELPDWKARVCGEVSLSDYKAISDRLHDVERQLGEAWQASGTSLEGHHGHAHHKRSASLLRNVKKKLRAAEHMMRESLAEKGMTISSPDVGGSPDSSGGASASGRYTNGGPVSPAPRSWYDGLSRGVKKAVLRSVSSGCAERSRRDPMPQEPFLQGFEYSAPPRGPAKAGGLPRPEKKQT